MPRQRPRANTNGKAKARQRKRSAFPDILTVIIHPDGTVSHLHTDDFAFSSLGPRTIRRASQVEPTPDGSRWEVRLPDSHRLIATTKHRTTALQREQRILTTRILPNLASAFDPL